MLDILKPLLEKINEITRPKSIFFQAKITERDDHHVKVNEEIFESQLLSSYVKTGDIVDILTSKHSYGPGQDWLKIAQSSNARSKIKAWFKKEKRSENIAKGKESVERELQRGGYDPSEFMTTELLKDMRDRLLVLRRFL